MQVFRTVIWIVVTIVLVAFIAMNWHKAPVNFWPLEEDYLHFEWPVGVIALVFFLLGLLPAWLVHRATRWRLNRRIASLENNLRVVAAPPAEDVHIEAAPLPSVAPPIP
ncbi:MAG TPA: LapA family protein [Novosphingobium sp.]|nr:LapA family protein [Novosphingobium sp.]